MYIIIFLKIGYNLKLKKALGPHPNCWKWIERIKGEETEYSVKFERVEKNNLKGPRRNRKDVEFDLKLERAKVAYLEDVNDDIMRYEKEKM